MKSVFKKTLASIVAVASLAAVAPAAVSAEGTQPTGYVAASVGDNVAATRYGNIVAESTGAGVYDYAALGLASSDIKAGLDALIADETSIYDAYGMSRADYITVSVGLYDVLSPFINEIAKAVDAEIGANDKETVANIKATVDAMSDAEQVAAAGKIGTALEENAVINAAVSAFVANANGIVEDLKAINPDATIYFTNIYSPYVDVVNEEVANFIGLNEYLEGYIGTANTALGAISGVELVDIATIFKDHPEYVKAGADTEDYRPTPTAEGAKAIADAVAAKITAGVKGDVNSDGKFNIADGVLLAKKLADPTVYYVKTANADLTADGDVTQSDLVALIQAIASK